MTTYITTSEAGRVLGLSPETVRRYARQGMLRRYYPSGRVGYGLRFDAGEVRRLLKARGVRPEITPLAEHEQRVRDEIEERRTA